MDKYLTFGIIGWTEDDIGLLYEDLLKRKITTEDMIITRDATKSFAKNMNEILDEAGTEIVYVLCAGIQIIQDDWFEGMLQYMRDREDVGIMYCWNDRHAFYDQAPVYDNPVGTGANLMVRRSLGVRMDEEFILSQWEDQDFGREMQYQGYRVVFDQRVSVFHPPSDYTKKKLFYQVYSLQNHLLLETKWREVGRKNWSGIKWWNKQNRWNFSTESELKNWSKNRCLEFIEKTKEIIDHLLKKPLIF